MPLDSSDFMAGDLWPSMEADFTEAGLAADSMVAATINHLPVVGSIPVTSALLIVKGGVVFAMI